MKKHFFWFGLSTLIVAATAVTLWSAAHRAPDSTTSVLVASLAEAGTIQIMPFGDSITSGLSYRQPLAELLKTSPTRTEYVGSITGSGRSESHEGHPCYRLTAVLLPAGTGTFKKCIPEENSFGDARDLDIWFSTRVPDIVLWHIGTNDVWNGEPVDRIMLAYSATLSKLRQRNPRVAIVVAQILPMAMANVAPLNVAIADWAAQNTSATSPITVVDMNTGFDLSWTRDGVHPNATGTQWMAKKWFRALQPLLTGAQPARGALR